MALAPLRIAQPNVRLIDPHTLTDDRSVLNLRYALYEPLVRRLAGGAFAPHLAQTWTVAEDARTWTLTLARTVRFHDGRVLTAADVVATLRRVVDPTDGGRTGYARRGGRLSGRDPGCRFARRHRADRDGKSLGGFA